MISSFLGDGWAGEMDEVLDQLEDVRAMIIDVRNNNGGNRTLAIDIAGRFTDRTQTFGYIRLRNGPGHGDFTDYIPADVSPRGPRQFTGPVYVLSNRHDFSSAEDFILAMRGTGSATIVGDTTAGVTGGPIVRELANGWTYELSQWIEYTSGQEDLRGHRPRAGHRRDIERNIRCVPGTIPRSSARSRSRGQRLQVADHHAELAARVAGSV